ncbi:hypothetical protein BVRB_3g064610 [Beta vulgaris subsp. vulgaris]|nr:hypothetical protein BVRB_3g064610 [Beta vulgaris subsp. vulgaris]
MVGYASEQKGYRVFDLQRRKVFVSRDVIFKEEIFPFLISEHNKEGKKAVLGDFISEREMIDEMEEEDDAQPLMETIEEEPIQEEMGRLEEETECEEENATGEINEETREAAIIDHENIVMDDSTHEHDVGVRRSTRDSIVPVKFKNFVCNIPGKQNASNMVEKFGMTVADLDCYFVWLCTVLPQGAAKCMADFPL